MPKKIPVEVVSEIRRRAANGECRAHLATEFGLSRSTVCIMVLGTGYVNYSDSSHLAERAKLVAAKMTPARVIGWRKAIARGVSRFRKEFVRTHPGCMKKLVAARQSIRTPLETGYAVILEKLYGPLQHMEVNGRWFDFVNQDFIIETTEDHGKGVCSATRRFSVLGDDHRKRILFCPRRNVGKVRRDRLSNLRVAVLDIEELKQQST